MSENDFQELKEGLHKDLLKMASIKEQSASFTCLECGETSRQPWPAHQQGFLPCPNPECGNEMSQDTPPRLKPGESPEQVLMLLAGAAWAALEVYIDQADLDGELGDWFFILDTAFQQYVDSGFFLDYTVDVCHHIVVSYMESMERRKESNDST